MVYILLTLNSLLMILLPLLLGIWLDAEVSNHEGCPWLDEPIPEEFPRAIDLLADGTLDPEGALWIADAGRAKLRRWNPDEGLTTPFADQRLAMPHGVAVTPTGQPSFVVQSTAHSDCSWSRRSIFS